VTKAELIARVQLQLNNPEYFTDQNISDSLQDGLDEIVPFTGLSLLSASIPFQNNLTYYDLQSLLPNFLAIYAVYNRTTKRWMYPNSLRRFDADRIDWETATGTPYFFCPISYRYMAIYKKPVVDNYGDMWVWYVGTAESIDNSGPLIPNTLRTEVLEAYTFMDLNEQNQEWTKAGTFFNTYQAKLQELRTFIQNGRLPDRIMHLNP
jgi:hypothetical protein